MWCRLTLSWEESWRVSGCVGSCRRAVSQVCCRSWVAVGRRWGSMCNILRTRSLASFDTLAQLPLAKSSLHSLIRCRMSVGVSLGPFANGLFLFKPKRTKLMTSLLSAFSRTSNRHKKKIKVIIHFLFLSGLFISFSSIG